MNSLYPDLLNQIESRRIAKIADTDSPEKRAAFLAWWNAHPSEEAEKLEILNKFK